jgi:hypothetical protein
MSSIVTEAEDMVLCFFEKFDEDDLRSITSPYELEKRIDEETEYEMKERMWYLLKQRINWSKILQTLHDSLTEQDDEEDNDENDS